MVQPRLENTWAVVLFSTATFAIDGAWQYSGYKTNLAGLTSTICLVFYYFLYEHSLVRWSALYHLLVLVLMIGGDILYLLYDYEKRRNAVDGWFVVGFRFPMLTRAFLPEHSLLRARLVCLRSCDSSDFAVGAVHTCRRSIHFESLVSKAPELFQHAIAAAAGPICTAIACSYSHGSVVSHLPGERY